ncbi:four-helix bundle copper-binding protein [Streptosporangium sp. NPDC002544]|uniref:four-helix bundle copper-binding protein n=1 Tax=unclassified Streptosporangium TaxID=2632669 RepID=UPI003327F3B9
MSHAVKMNPQVQKSIDMCLESHSRCEQTMTYCLMQGGRYADMALIGPLMDCADMTRLCADMMMRQSPMAKEMATMCAKAANKCADACMSMENDPMMKECADACRAWAEACRTMANARS